MLGGTASSVKTHLHKIMNTFLHTLNTLNVP